MRVSVVVPTHDRADLLERLLVSLAAQSTPCQIVVVDNGSSASKGSRDLSADLPGVEVERLDRNVGYGRAVNLGARRATGEVLVLVNDDCVCEPTFVERMAAGVDPGRGVVMAAGVLVEPDDPERIDSAGMELDRTLLPFDYLNGMPVAVLDQGVPHPIGPSAAAAAFWRSEFLAVGGFDERLFAYWEDVDLVLRLRRRGGRCVLASDARATHEHSATLGTGSVRKNYLMGFGRGYVVRKWNAARPARLARLVAHDLVVCVGQAAFDRNVAGVRGRLDGFRAARDVERFPYPGDLLAPAVAPSTLVSLSRRARRRLRLRERAATNQ
jgi:N-acetylglucosaminyl-diphospho-decaprenol L-rhamnosyltransferase